LPGGNGIRRILGCVKGHLRQRSADSFQLIVYVGRDPVSGKDR